MPRVVQQFLHTETSSGIVLLAAAVAALVWANSPWQDSYHSLWHTSATIDFGPLHLEEDLVHWVNDALMTVFFLVVGLEIKRELVVGDLGSWRRAALPAIAAVGGMVVPAALFAVINAGEVGGRGWGVPMATDIAFAVGVMALLGRRVPSSLKLFLLTLAIVDDIGAIVVIAIFYSKGLDGIALGAAGALVAGIVVLRVLRVAWMAPYVVLGAGLWLAMFQSGVHATIAGVILGLLAPARPMGSADAVHQWAAVLGDEPSAPNAHAMSVIARNSVSVAERLVHALHPYSSFVILPIFAFANAGVSLDLGAISEPGPAAVAFGVALGLVVGKPLGVFAFAWGAARLGVGELPAGVRLPQLFGAAAVAGVGFTVALFVAELAFDSEVLLSAAKVGILGASLTASLLGAGILLIASRAPRPVTEGPQDVVPRGPA